MTVLYNGEYTDFDITTLPCWEDKLAKQQKFYPQWEGKVYGDFEIVKIEWDWFLSKQRALVRCTHCGAEKYVNSPKNFRKGNISQRCECQKPKKIENPKKEIIKYVDFVGEERNGFLALKYVPQRGMRVRCLQCQNEKWAMGKDFLNGSVTCSHKKAIKDEDVIGKRFGNLTVLERRGSVYLCKCDCGFERELAGYKFVGGYTQTCGRSGCEFHKNRVGDTRCAERRKKGLDFEHKLQDIFEQAGYEVIRTPDSCDYGVDFMANILGEKWAFQCKQNKTATNSHAVMEVYAGGRFYDCTRFCVASPSGFSHNAMKMAAKLGVQLETNKFTFGVKLSDNTAQLLETANYACSGQKEWTINGVTKTRSEWCKEYNVTRGQVAYRVSKGMSPIEALTYTKPRGWTYIEINGVTKTKIEWCEEYGISTHLFDYRTKQGGMTPYEALTTPKEK